MWKSLAIVVLVLIVGCGGPATERAADNAAKMGDWQRAVDLYTAALKSTSSASTFAKRAGANFHLKRYAEAERDYDRALQGMSSDQGHRGVMRSLVLGRAKSRLKMAMYEEAVKDLDRAMTLPGNDHEAILLRGEALVELKQFARAMADAKSALAHEKTARGFVLRGRVHFGQEKLQTAENDFALAIAADSTHAQSYWYRAQVFEKSGRNDLAKADREQAARLNPMFGLSNNKSAPLRGDRSKSISPIDVDVITKQ